VRNFLSGIESSWNNIITRVYYRHNLIPADNNIFFFSLSLGGGRFYDPRTKQSFKYDHLRKEATDFQNYEPDAVAEPWRSALDVEAIQYTANHYRQGVCSVFSRNDPSTNQITLSLCIEDHQFQPQNYWNGRWRSQWNFTFSNSGSGAAEVKGVLKVQVSVP
jgi:capping protein (actin filament) muscle Z-line, alpha